MNSGKDRVSQRLVLNKIYPNNPHKFYLYHMEPIKPDSRVLVDIIQTKMPFGKYKGTFISELPVYYLEWFKNKGFPPGKLGMMLSSVYEIKINGLNSILTLVKTTLKTQR